MIASLLEVSYTGKRNLAPPLSSVDFQVGTVNDQYNHHRSILSTDSAQD